MEYNNNFEYDLKVGQVGEKLLGDILESKTIEIKTDLQAHRTGNIFVEYYSRNKPSGVATSTADFYAFILSNEKIIIIKTTELKTLCRRYLNTPKDIKGGDCNTSKGVLVPLSQLLF